VSKAFSISKNTAAVDILLLKFQGHMIHKPHTLKCHAVTCEKPN
jgi:hypothetical protein